MADLEMDFNYLSELSSDFKTPAIPVLKKSSSKREVARAAPDSAAIKAVNDKKRKVERKEADKYNKDRDNLLAKRAENQALTGKTIRLKKVIKGETSASDDLLCEADDYGYESNFSQQMFDKLTNQYDDIPEDESLKFHKKKSNTSMDDIKKRVLQSLKDGAPKIKDGAPKIKDEPVVTVRRKRKSVKTDEQMDDFINDGNPYNKDKKRKESRDGGHSSSYNDKIQYDYDKKKQSEREKEKKEKEREEKKDKEKEREEKKDKEKEREEKKDKEKEREEKKDKEKEREEKKDKEKEREEKKDKEKEREKKKRRQRQSNTAPPALDFAALMKLAQTKQSQPPTPDTTVADILQEKIKRKERERNERPLSAKEKDEMEEQRLRHLRRSGKLTSAPVSKLKEALEKKRNVENNIKNNEKSHSSDIINSKIQIDKSRSKEPPREKVKEKEPPKPDPKPKDKSKYFAVPGASKSNGSSSSSDHNKPKNNSHSSSQLSRSSSSATKTASSNKGRQFSPPDVKSSKNKARDFHPSDVRQQSSKPPASHHSRLDSDSEYDSEMDDFIDDGDAGLDYSSVIKQVFGYDKNKFRDEDEDLSDMEVGYNEMEQEEERSAKIGLQEDLEDMKMEEAEKRRKMMRKKKMEQLSAKGRRR